jgi:hypothetical protein
MMRKSFYDFHAFLDVASEEDLHHFPLFWLGSNNNEKKLPVGREQYPQVFQILESKS